MLCVIQEYLLHNAMSIFTFVGSNLAQHDDAYSFQLITRTIDTVIPALVTVSILTVVTHTVLTVAEHSACTDFIEGLQRRCRRI